MKGWTATPPERSHTHTYRERETWCDNENELKSALNLIFYHISYWCICTSVSQYWSLNLSALYHCWPSKTCRSASHMWKCFRPFRPLCVSCVSWNQLWDTLNCLEVQNPLLSNYSEFKLHHNVMIKSYYIMTIKNAFRFISDWGVFMGSHMGTTQTQSEITAQGMLQVAIATLNHGLNW